MINEAMAGKIDMIVTKSISRFCKKYPGLPQVYPTA